MWVEKSQRTCEKDCNWNPTTWRFENVEYWTSTIDDSLNTFDEVLNGSANVMNTVSTNFQK